MAHLRALYDLSRELAAISDMRGVAASFLGHALRALGMSHGVVLLHGAEGAESLFVQKGFEDAEGRRLLQGRDALLAYAKDREALPGEDVRLSPSESSFPLPADICISSSWLGADGEAGFFAFGLRGCASPPGPDDAEFIRNLTLVLAGALDRAAQGGVIERLNRTLEAGNRELADLNYDLERRNRELVELLEEVSQCRIEVGSIQESRERILSAVRRETSRLGRVRAMDFVFVLIVSLCLGLLFNSVSPNRVDILPQSWFRSEAMRMDVDEAKATHDAGVLFIDARPAEFFRKGRIRGAVNVPANLFDFIYSMRLAARSRDERIVVYGHTVSSAYDDDVAHLLFGRGFTNVSVLSGGLSGWAERGYPVEP
ncbi:rhodanese-related sulfurtransferase [Desulfobaculum xiamenense]|uniref:Rhodanese-related sulfurtransferase n=1 Tax=Desulfobaculum xiamenense TaxID=995050 RepID=A0A846QCE3_9BACT|nr:rhodanese-like domain-containing protein [Desulfobaculum xiamenense]NJB66376.1 rhodanese-related sulfurtransferase [Desulfobaculum xiamenense]